MISLRSATWPWPTVSVRMLTGREGWGSGGCCGSPGRRRPNRDGACVSPPDRADLLADLARTWHAQGWAYAAGRPELAALAWAHARDIEEALMGDGIALTDLGQTTHLGRARRTAARTWRSGGRYSPLQILRGRIKACLDIVQAYGWSDKSGGTHGQGTAVDTAQTSAGIVADARGWCPRGRGAAASGGSGVDG